MLVCAAIGCKERSAPHTPPTPSPPAGDAAVVESPRRAVSLVTDPVALASVGAAGGNFAALFGAPAATNTALLSEASPRYAALVATISGDIASVAAAHPGAGVGVRGHNYRMFDERWLHSPQTRFDLVGIAPRIDRARPPHDCGDVRLLYRLTYDADVGGERITSRLPLTISVSLAARPNDVAHSCRPDAMAWRARRTLPTMLSANGS